MLDENKLLAVQLIVEGKLTKTEIAEKCGRSRQWLYELMSTDIFKAELDRRLHVIRTEGNKIIVNNLSKSIENLVYLANNSPSDKIKMDSNIYLVNRSLGMPTSKHEIEAITDMDNSKVSLEEFEAELEEVDVDIIEELDGEELED